MSEFRKNIVSGEWIIIAPERAKRPHEFLPKKQKRIPTPKDGCPFEDIKKTGNWPPYIAVPDEENWEVVIIPNKYPALMHGKACPVVLREGPYERSEGMGYHDLLLFREHDVPLDEMSADGLCAAFSVLQSRYKDVEKDPCLVYTSTHFNWGESAGASLYHPHFQIITLPIIPPHILHSLAHSSSYFQINARCVHCTIIKYEIENKVRVVAENELAIAVTPFASRQPLEIKIYPKNHIPHFEHTEKDDLCGVVEILKLSLSRIKENLNDPDLNFFIHTAPAKNRGLYSHYHWHVEIIPKISVPAGFELSTGVLINMMAPETSARMLRGEE